MIDEKTQRLIEIRNRLMESYVQVHDGVPYYKTTESFAHNAPYDIAFLLEFVAEQQEKAQKYDQLCK